MMIASLAQLFNLNSIYFLGYSWLFGMSIWVTFFAGFIAIKSLPRPYFGALQHKVFPVYFLLSITISSGLLGLWILKHPDVLYQLSQPNATGVLVVYAHLSVILSQASNYFVILPITKKITSKRQKLEKEEGKSYTDPGVSQDMKALNRQFGKVHGVSSLLNLSAIIALLFHGLLIANTVH